MKRRAHSASAKADSAETRRIVSARFFLSASGARGSSSVGKVGSAAPEASGGPWKAAGAGRVDGVTTSVVPSELVKVAVPRSARTGAAASRSRSASTVTEYPSRGAPSRGYTAGMKTILIVVALGAAVWFGMKKLHDTAAAKQITDAPANYTKSLQNDTVKAQAAVDAANAAIKQTSAETQKAVDSAAAQ